MTPWTPVAEQSETWTEQATASETWASASAQAETWSEQTQPMRVFDPYVFDRSPIFDTGIASGIWDAIFAQSEVWIAA